MHPATIIGTFRSLIVDVAMGQIPRSTERISSCLYDTLYIDTNIFKLPDSAFAAFLRGSCALQIALIIIIII